MLLLTFHGHSDDRRGTKLKKVALLKILTVLEYQYWLISILNFFGGTEQIRSVGLRIDHQLDDKNQYLDHQLFGRLLDSTRVRST